MDSFNQIMWTILCVVGIWRIFAKFWNYLRAVWLALRLPGPAALPIVGNVFVLKNTNALIEIANNVSQQYPPMARTWMFLLPIILVYEPDHLKLILSNTRTSDKNFFYRIMHNFIGDGLITSTSDKWKKHRRLIQPYFQTQPLETYFEEFAKASDKMIVNLFRKQRVHISKIVNECVLRILHKVVLGVDLAESDNTSPFRRGELLLIKRALKPWLLWDAVFRHSKLSEIETKQNNELHMYVKKIVAEHKKSSAPCLLDQLIETDEFSEEDIINEAVTFMLAGQDSVGAAVAFCLHFLAKNLQIQDKVFREINEITNGDLKKPFTVDQINQMHYLEQCLKETMRLLPSVPIIARVLSADVHLGTHTIPCGTNILISPFATHRLPHIFSDPLTFDPNRFSHENLKKMHPYAFLPFSSGPRNCIGYKFAYMEMKTLIASLLKQYCVSLENDCEQLTLVYRVTLRAKGGVWLNIAPRNAKYID